MWVDTCDLFLPLLLPLYDVNEVLQLSFQIYVLILAPNTRSSTGFLIKSLLKVWRLPADQNLSKCGKDVFLFFFSEPWIFVLLFIDGQCLVAAMCLWPFPFKGFRNLPCFLCSTQTRGTWPYYLSPSSKQQQSSCWF